MYRFNVINLSGDNQPCGCNFNKSEYKTMRRLIAKFESIFDLFPETNIGIVIVDSDNHMPVYVNVDDIHIDLIDCGEIDN